MHEPDERERVAYHEGGHTILGLLVPGADPVNRVTIMPRGQALGVTYQRPEDDRHNYSEGYLRARITGALGGRAAEEVVYGGRTHRLRERHAAGDRPGPPDGHALGHERGARAGDAGAARQPVPRRSSDSAGAASQPYSEATAQLVDAEVRRILQECYADGGAAAARAPRRSWTRWREALLEHETLDEQEILRVTGLPRAPQLETMPIPARAGGEGAMTPTNGARSSVRPV